MRGAVGTAALGVTLALAAGMFDAEPLYVPGVGFALLGSITAAWVWGAARGATVSRTLEARRVVEDEPLRIRVSARAGRLSLPGSEVHDELLDEPVRLDAQRGEAAIRINARFARRGRKTLAAPTLLVRDPLGLASWVVSGGDPDEVLVLPRIDPVRAVDGGGEGTVAGRLASPLAAAQVEVDGVRPGLETTPASRIYWPGLARGRGLMERRLRADSDQRPIVVLDTRAPASEEDLDAAARAAASLCIHLARRGGCSVLLPRDRRPTTLEATLGGWPHLHARLALVPADLAPPNTGLAGRRGSIVYVCAHVPARMPRALAGVAAAGRILVTPGRLPGHSPAFEVGGCLGYELWRAGAGGLRAPAARVA
ncbi:MAG: hypothetical protein QOI98_1648 [Solirubrobacteraceae bacterium]|jgi:uncharacterized protein (DUF58 family)|nr:hypothetical protein [Solirubrobacteraceae bacterium]